MGPRIDGSNQRRLIGDQTLEGRELTPKEQRLIDKFNPDQVSLKQMSKVEIEKSRTSKTGEKNLEGKLQQASLQKVFDERLGVSEITPQRYPGAIELPKFGPGDGPGAIEMPTFGPGNGPGAIEMPKPDAANKTESQYHPEAIELPKFGPGDGPGAIKMPTFDQGNGPGAIEMPKPDAVKKTNS